MCSLLVLDCSAPEPETRTAALRAPPLTVQRATALNEPRTDGAFGADLYAPQHLSGTTRWCCSQMRPPTWVTNRGEEQRLIDGGLRARRGRRGMCCMWAVVDEGREVAHRRGGGETAGGFFAGATGGVDLHSVVALRWTNTRAPSHRFSGFCLILRPRWSFSSNSRGGRMPAGRGSFDGGNVVWKWRRKRRLRGPLSSAFNNARKHQAKNKQTRPHSGLEEGRSPRAR